MATGIQAGGLEIDGEKLHGAPILILTGKFSPIILLQRPLRRRLIAPPSLALETERV